MRQGFIKVAALTPKVTVADTQANRKEICRLMDEAEARVPRYWYFRNCVLPVIPVGICFFRTCCWKRQRKHS